jgi:hypothetical protein
MIDMREEVKIIAKRAMQTARFQRNSDGQFVGRVRIEGEEFECFLVFDKKRGEVRNPWFLRLSFEKPL